MADIDECWEPNACEPNANCIDSIGGFSCPCKDGYIKDNGLCVGETKPQPSAMSTMAVQMFELNYCSFCRIMFHCETIDYTDYIIPYV